MKLILINLQYNYLLSKHLNIKRESVELSRLSTLRLLNALQKINNTFHLYGKLQITMPYKVMSGLLIPDARNYLDFKARIKAKALSSNMYATTQQHRNKANIMKDSLIITDVDNFAIKNLTVLLNI